MSGQVHVTTDNSTYNSVLSVSGGDSDSVNGAVTGSVFINVTDVSNVKIKLRATSMDNASYVIGNSTTTTTNVMFERVAPAQ